MTDEIRMPTRMETLRRTARRLVLGRADLETVGDIVDGAAATGYAVAALLIRIALFLTLPLSALLLYPLMRANNRRWYAYAKSEEVRRAELIAELTKATSKPIEWPHQWPRGDDAAAPSLQPGERQG